MKTKFLLIAFLIALAISIVACDGDTPASPEIPAATTTAKDGEAETTTTTTATTTATTTTKNGIIELPPVDVR